MSKTTKNKKDSFALNENIAKESEESHSLEERTITKKKILIVGDWVVDDYWVLANHRSSKGSRKGLMHHRALQKRNASIRAFCGAGQTASILHDANINGLEILGLGIWAKDDESYLISLFDAENTRFQNPHRLSREEINFSEVKGVTLCNMGNFLFSDKITGDQSTPTIDLRFGTSRIIRTYLKSGDTITQLERIDWELPAPNVDGHLEWKFRTIELNKKLPDVSEVDCIVIKDMGKGVVSNSIIKLLAEKYKKRVPWYISSKSWRPSWLTDNIQNIDLRLLIIPQIAAQTAIHDDHVNTWITSAGYASKKALEMVSTLRANNSETIIVILPSNLNILAFNKKYGLVFRDNTPRFSIETNMASVFFGYAISKLRTSGSSSKNKTTGKTDFQEFIETILNQTYNWQIKEIDRIKNPDAWDPNCHKESNGEIQTMLRINEPMFEIKHAIDEWEDATDLTKLGIVKGNNNTKTHSKENNIEKFELWRSMVDVDGYVCFADSKQKEISKLMHAIHSYTKNFVSKTSIVPHSRIPHASCLLYAKPGTGKTSLVRKLAETNKLKFIPYNITEMIRLSDILDCFDTIVTSHLQNPSKPMLIFFDEINSPLENEAAYKAFLAPLEDGTYIRGGKSFKLPQCFWVFASTIPAEEIKTKTESKGSDFISRLSHGMISLDIPSQTEASQKQLENIYVCVSMTLAIFPDVREISRIVLDVFSRGLIKARMREMRHFIESFADVQYGKVSMNNIPINYKSNSFRTVVSDPVEKDIVDNEGCIEIHIQAFKQREAKEKSIYVPIISSADRKIIS